MPHRDESSRILRPPILHRTRVVIDSVEPMIDHGLFPIKRVVGDVVQIKSVLLCDGHDCLKGNLLFRFEDDKNWQRTALRPLYNDIWQAEFTVERLGSYFYTIEARVDEVQTQLEHIKKRLEYLEPIDNALGNFVEFLVARSGALPATKKKYVLTQADAFKKQIGSAPNPNIQNLLDDPKLCAFVNEANRDEWTTYTTTLRVSVDREKAIFGAWYELFPRSTSTQTKAHGTLDDCAKRLEYVADLGFDVVYLPPIHPIGKRFRKGQNGVDQDKAGDVGSPWAIGSDEGGHKSIHPQLGDMEAFKRFKTRATELKLELALDLAFQCAPDHPYVKKHPEWFKKNPDGSIQYAENPPKKYQDIVPFNFECADQDALFAELKSIVTFWIDRGIRIFRVDNPHTKPFYFWQWLLDGIKREYPDVIFLSEAFTRPHVMAYLAKIGFSQSYTYFTWRSTKSEFTAYLQELTQTDLAEFLRPNFWPNTPDILAQTLQNAPSSAFIQRFVLASTLAASYGIYGPAFEQCENTPREEGSEEYLNSEKYELRRWNLKAPNITKVISRINRIRRENSALHRNASLRFHSVDNDSLLAYSKCSSDMNNIVLVVVNLDPHHKKSGVIDLDLQQFGIGPTDTYQLHDMLSDTRHFWRGPRNQIEIDPQVLPACIFLLMRKARSEEEFEYYA